MFPIINPSTFVFTAAMALGVLVHDTQIDRAAGVALALPAAYATYAAVDAAVKSSEHIHVEKVAAPANFAGVPRIQPRDDDRRYVQARKFGFNNQDSTSLWPSI